MKTKLSKREQATLEFMQQGFKNKAIAQELDLNEKTISTYKARMKRKLGIDEVYNDYKTVIIAEQKGVIKRYNAL